MTRYMMVAVAAAMSSLLIHDPALAIQKNSVSFGKSYLANKVKKYQQYAISYCGGSCCQDTDCSGNLICQNRRCTDDPDEGSHICSRPLERDSTLKKFVDATMP
jgi:hypothetical protein